MKDVALSLSPTLKIFTQIDRMKIAINNTNSLNLYSGQIDFEMTTLTSRLCLRYRFS